MTDTRAKRHNQRMKKQKEIVDAGIEKSNIERGVVIVITGNGKGKTTAALGTLLRSLGHGHQCVLAQFIKGQWDCGETAFFTANTSISNLKTFTMNTGFTWESQSFEKDKLAAQTIWQEILPFFSDKNCQLIVLDEITYLFKYRYLDIRDVMTAIKHRPMNQNIILTGRGATKELIEIADTVSEINALKHAFNQGIKAQQGIEW